MPWLCSCHTHYYTFTLFAVAGGTGGESKECVVKNIHYFTIHLLQYLLLYYTGGKGGEGKECHFVVRAQGNL
jgi:hypothetical protein